MNARKITRLRVLLFTLLMAVLSACILLLFFAESWGWALYDFFVVPLTQRFYLGNLIAHSIPLIVAGLGVSFAFASRNFNLGGEGQLYAGALASTLVALAVPEISPFAALCASFLAAIVAGGILGGISGYLKRRLGVDELISSFLISAAVILLVDYLVTVPFQDPASNFQTTLPIPGIFMLRRILPPSSLSTGIFFAIAIAIAGKAVLDKTKFGFELRLCGINREFARYSGIDNGFYTVLPMTISGALHGLAGALMVFGSYRATMRGFSAGAGWNAIAVSLIAGNNPLALIPASLFYSYLEAGSKSVLMSAQLRSEIASIIQSVLFLLITAGRIPFSKDRITLRKAEKT
jgi:simple sugar transport system permease protein